MFAVILNVTLIFSAVSLGLPVSLSWAASSGASGKIVFVSNRDGRDQIYVMNVDGSLQTRLTMDKRPVTTVDKKAVPIGSDDHPAWSPDGTQILFDSNRDGDRDIYVMNSDGSGVNQLTNDPASDSFPAWSPDGKKIAFQSDRDCTPDNCLQTEIYVMNADGSRQERITIQSSGSGISDQHPAWSPDYGQIAFDSNRDGDYEIYVLDVDNPIRVKEVTYNTKPVDDTFPVWSPDGKKIAYDSTRWNHEIWVMNAADGSDGHFLIPRSWKASVTENAAWSPNGSLIAFDSYRDDPAGKQREIYVTSADGAEPERLTFSVHEDMDPDWHEDGLGPPLSTTQSLTVTATMTATASVAATRPVTAIGPVTGVGSYSLVAPYLGWIGAIAALVILTIGLLRYRRGYLTLRRLGGTQTQAEKYLVLLAKLDQMHEHGEISEGYYLRLKREYEEKL
jgi:TolB protein